MKRVDVEREGRSGPASSVSAVSTLFGRLPQQLNLTPELALLAGNVFSYLVSPKTRYLLKLKAALLSGSASSPAVRAPDAPEALRPPADQVLKLETLAKGVQIYECSAGQDQPVRFEWVFKAPEAELFDRSGRKVGKHYAGPTWESTDGSAVVGEVKARDDGPDPSAIPWLLLSAKSNSGTGVFSQIKSIQRLKTVGGKAPTSPCSQDNARQVARVPYKAAYYFYIAKQ